MIRADYPLEEWERFTAKAMTELGVFEVAVGHVYTLTEGNVVRFYGVGDIVPEGHPTEHAWLRPQDVPTRVLRGDGGRPTHPLEWRRIHEESHARWQADRARKPTDEEKLAARLAGLPEPEVRARPATLEEIPRGAKTIGVKATKNGFEVDARYARGPRVDQYWKVVEISDTIMIRGRHQDGRRFGAMWITKTGQSGAKEGVTSWEAETAYLMQDGIWTACNMTELSAYLVTSE